MTLAELAEALKVESKTPLRTIKTWTQRQDDPLPAFRLQQGMYLFDRNEVEAWLSRQRTV